LEGRWQNEGHGTASQSKALWRIPCHLEVVHSRANLHPMPAATVTQKMPVAAGEVFALLHDYPRRLEWDTLLREARLTGGFTKAEKGATSLCVGNAFGGLVGIETRYVSFRPGELAAVEMINRPPFFEKFAASIRHRDVADGSEAIYKLHFTARPKWLRCCLEPLMLRFLRHETQKRLRALAEFLK
jgi:hypothetical protein